MWQLASTLVDFNSDFSPEEQYTCLYDPETGEAKVIHWNSEIEKSRMSKEPKEKPKEREFVCRDI